MSRRTQGFAQRLSSAIAASGMTTQQLARECDNAFTPRTIFRWKAGVTVPGIEALPILADALGVSADWLLGITDNATPEGRRI